MSEAASPSPKLVVSQQEDAPSEAIIKKARRVATIDSHEGVRLTVRRLGPVQRMDLGRIIGAEAATNPMIINPASCAFAVTEIDGEPVTPPINLAELRLLVGRLDDDGIDAVERCYVREGWSAQEAARDPDAVKNS